MNLKWVLNFSAKDDDQWLEQANSLLEDFPWLFGKGKKSTSEGKTEEATDSTSKGTTPTDTSKAKNPQPEASQSENAAEISQQDSASSSEEVDNWSKSEQDHAEEAANNAKAEGKVEKETSSSFADTSASTNDSFRLDHEEEKKNKNGRGIPGDAEKKSSTEEKWSNSIDNNVFYQDDSNNAEIYSNEILESSMDTNDMYTGHQTTYLPRYETAIFDHPRNYPSYSYDIRYTTKPFRGSSFTPAHSPIFAQVVIGTDRHYARCSLIKSHNYFPETVTKYIYVTPSVAPRESYTYYWGRLPRPRLEA